MTTQQATVTYYVEVFSCPWPDKGRRFRTHRHSYFTDSLSPGLISLLRVQAHTKEDAVAQCLSGKGVQVI